MKCDHEGSLWVEVSAGVKVCSLCCAIEETAAFHRHCIEWLKTETKMRKAAEACTKDLERKLKNANEAQTAPRAIADLRGDVLIAHMKSCHEAAGDHCASLAASLAEIDEVLNVRELWVVEGFHEHWYPRYGEAFTNKEDAEHASKIRGKARVVRYTPDSAAPQVPETNEPECDSIGACSHHDKHDSPSVRINGVVFSVGKPTILEIGQSLSFENIACLVGIDPETNPTITYRHGGDSHAHERFHITRGQAVIVDAGMIFNVANTGAA